ncbi:subtilisin-like protease 1 [Triticum aestivum]|uniref:subtilisin-like protease 1 n=1 Tax=Triticum aestivum TaxID=4565 RepID=UPI001D0334D7|nr:subtilisin-like protease 1 [Triticum aestivum]
MHCHARMKRNNGARGANSPPQILHAVAILGASTPRMHKFGTRSISISPCPSSLAFASSPMMGYPGRLAALLLVAATATAVVAHNDHGEHKNYLVIVRTPYEYDRNLYKNVSSWHASLLASVCDQAKEQLDADPGAAERLIYSYRNVINGFAARLTPDELHHMGEKDWFLKALPEQTYQLTTTHTPRMLGLTGPLFHAGLWNRTNNMGEGMIIGILDGGIAGAHPSFDGTGMPPPPAKWKGRCDFNRSVCNNKLIGARSFYESAKWRWEGIDDPVLPIDDSAHGTHVSSTAVGAFVPGANAMGSGFGTAAGMAPRAHLAFYQVCFVGKGCDRDDILAAIDDALDEGIDVLSMSLGADDAGDFAADPIALGGFSSVMRGVFVCTSAGNQGPSPATVANEAPWLLTVAAATTDRTFSADVKFGNGLVINGESHYQPSTYVSVQQPLVRDTAADGTCSDKTVLTAQHVAGKIVLCISGGNLTNLEKGSILHDAGAIAMIIVLPEDVGSVISPKAHALPATQGVEAKWSEKIMAYVNSTQSPTAQLVFRGAVLGNRMAPVVAPFSSRGPSRQNQGILKPDITGPGVNIIAAVPMPNGLAQPPNEMAYKFDIMSGTSMSTPHISGVAVLIKKAHPTWSPAAIKSAMMTTTDTRDGRRLPMLDQDGLPANLISMGAGFINPTRAMNPGLVYNQSAHDYIPYLCGLGYNDHEVSSIIHPAPPLSCKQLPVIHQKDLNYPSITVYLDKEPYAVNVSRALTNVDNDVGVYAASVELPPSLSAKVTPDILGFRDVNQVQTFTVTIRTKDGQKMKERIAEGQLKWVSRKHVVRSPILVSSKKFFKENSMANNGQRVGDS